MLKIPGEPDFGFPSHSPLCVFCHADPIMEAASPCLSTTLPEMFFFSPSKLGASFKATMLTLFLHYYFFQMPHNHYHYLCIFLIHFLSDLDRLTRFSRIKISFYTCINVNSLSNFSGVLSKNYKG